MSLKVISTLNKHKIMNAEKATKKTVNFLYTLLAIVLIWIGVIVIGVFLAWVFDGEQHLLRNVLIFPFTMGGIYITRWIWQHYR